MLSLQTVSYRFRIPEKKNNSRDTNKKIKRQQLLSKARLSYMSPARQEAGSMWEN